MEKFTDKKWFSYLKSKGILAGMSGLILVSCVPMGGYTETDGVYYDPNRDTLPEGTMTNSGTRVGDYYDYQATETDNRYLNSDNRNQNWNDNQESDWGAFTGTETYYSDNSWGSPFGFYSGFGFGMGFGWGSPWGFGGMYNPWGYNPWGFNSWYGHYSPYYGYYNPWAYNGYYGGNYGYPYAYGTGFNSYNGGFRYKRSGNDGAFRNTLRNSNSNFRNTNNSGFRNTNSNNNPRFNNQNNPRFNNQSGNFNNQSGIRNNSNSNPRQQNFPRQNTTRQNAPTYQQPTRSNDGGGFRSGGSGGGFNSGGSSSSGSTRSSGGGGFRR